MVPPTPNVTPPTTALPPVQMNNLNPKFVKTFDIVWQFEIRQDLEIHV